MSRSYVSNAGLVLLHPYLPQLFSALELVDNDQFVDSAAAERAALLLHYISSRSTESEQFELELNRVLCGMETATPLIDHIQITDVEEELIDSMLSAVITNWSTLGNTSIEGLRESFLKRDGVLTLPDEGWQLQVAPKPYDMLLDRLPWSLGPIRFPWMTGMLQVDWR